MVKVKERKNSQEFSGGPAVTTLRSHCQGPGLNLQIGELRSCKPQAMAKEKKEKKNPPLCLRVVFAAPAREPVILSALCWQPPGGAVGGGSPLCPLPATMRRGVRRLAEVCPWSHPDCDPSVSTHSSPEHITVLVPRLTLAPSTTTRRQSKDYPLPPDTLGAQLGVKEERKGD